MTERPAAAIEAAVNALQLQVAEHAIKHIDDWPALVRAVLDAYEDALPPETTTQDEWISHPDGARCEAVSSRGQRCALYRHHPDTHYYADAYRLKTG